MSGEVSLRTGHLSLNQKEEKKQPGEESGEAFQEQVNSVHKAQKRVQAWPI